MPPPLIINRLCQEGPTRHNAKHLFSVLSDRTRKGSGHELGAGHLALPAICAFLASEQAGRTEVSLEQARASVSMNSKTFDAALQRVRGLLSNSTKAPKQTRVTCNSLVRQYEIREDAGVAMAEVADTLNKSSALDGKGPQVEDSVTQCALFRWVCTKVFELNVPDFQVYDTKYTLSRREWFHVIRMLDEHCGHMLKDLAANARTAAANTRTRSQTSTHTQLALTPSSNKTTPLVDITPKKRLISSMQKRKERTDTKENETPSKRRKLFASRVSSPTKSRSVSSPNLVKEDATATPSHKIVLKVLQDDSEHETIDSIVVRPAKKTFRQPSISAWEAQRPGANTTAPAQTPSTKKNTSNDNGLLTNTPMTSTAMSDVFDDSPSSTRLARVGIRFQMTSSGAATSTPDEEIPRLRRRNLRAPFLDRDAYCWKPDARTTERLEQVRKWEALMISKYGEPWDKLAI